MTEEYLTKLQSFFSRPVATKGLSPLKDGIHIDIHVQENKTYQLTKKNETLSVIEKTDSNPEMTFTIEKEALEELLKFSSDDVGLLGIEIIKKMMDGQKIKAKVHVGLVTLTMKGYLGVLPLGGVTLIKHLASHGISLSKISKIISNLRSAK